MDAGSAAPWSEELLALLARNAPRLALARAEPDARTRADTDARRRALAAVALEARLRVGLATRAKAQQRVRHAAPVNAPPPPPTPPAGPPPAANLRLVVNHKWGLAARARARAAALRRQPLMTAAEDDGPGRWLAGASPSDDEFATLASHDGDERLAASSEERSSDSEAPSDADDPALEGSQPGGWPLEPGSDGLSERDADTVSTAVAEECSSGSVVEDAVGSCEPATRAEFVDAELQTDLYVAPVEALPAETSVGAGLQQSPSAASRRRQEPPAFPEYDSRRMLLSRLRMQRSMRVAGGPWLGGADLPKRVLGGSAHPEPYAAVEGAVGIEHHAAEESPHDAVAAEPQEVAVPPPEASQAHTPGASVLPTVAESSHAVPPIEGDVHPLDSLYAEHFVSALLTLLASEQSHGRRLDVRMELPLALLDQLPADVKRAGSTDRMLFDCINEALQLLTLGAEEVTVSLWHYRMSHLAADASVLDAVCGALNRQLRAWLACADVEDPRERQQRHSKCDVAAGECTWAASVQRHTAELQAAADSR
jgi:hypothetical protein